MRDTSAAREAIREAYQYHRDVMGGMSMAKLKLDAASGLLRLDPGESLPYPEDSPVWLEHASAGLAAAYEACEKLREAITSAQAEVTILADASPEAAGTETTDGH